MYLGRPYGWTQVGGDASAIYVNTKMANIIKPTGWVNWDSTEISPSTTNNGGGNVLEDARFAEYGTTDLLGNPVNTSGYVYSHQLTASQAADFTVDNVFGAYNWYGDGYPSTDTDLVGTGPGLATGTGTADPTQSNYSWPAFWGDRNVNNESNTDTLQNDPGSYSNLLWKFGGAAWDPTNQTTLVANADSLVPEPGSTALIGGLIMLPLALRPRRRSLAR
jgi:hypothetical protein